MTFEAPLLGLAALGAWLPILWLHRRRRRAPAAVVPALAPWLALVAPPVPRRRRVRASWLLLLHLAVAGALAAAVARPVLVGRAAGHGALALVVDATTSMAAGERWERAQRAAIERIDASSGPVTLVAAGAEARILAERASPGAARSALAALRPLGARSALDDALALARAVAGPGARLAVVTDGGAALVDPAGAEVVVVAEADPQREANAALLDVRGADDPDRGGRRLTARIANFGPAPRTVRVTLRVDGAPADRREVDLAAGEARPLAWRVRAGAERAEVRLDGGDVLPADDLAHAWLAGERLGVQVVGASSPVDRALAADAALVVRRAGPATLRADGSVDATVVVGTSLGRLPPGGIVWVAPPAVEGAPGSGAGRIAAVGDHPLVAGLDLAGAGLEGLASAPAPRWAEPVLLAGERVAAYAGFEAGRRQVVLAFDPERGDVAARAGFPLLVARAVRWVAAPSRVAGAVPLGARARLDAPRAVERPDGARVRTGELALDAPGLYRVERGDGPPILAAASAGDARESDLALRLASPRAAAGIQAGDAPGRPLWRAFAALAAALALAESAWRAAPARRERGA